MRALGGSTRSGVTRHPLLSKWKAAETFVCELIVKLILVEDDPIVLMCTSDALAEAGFDVLTATGGEEALSFLSDSPDCLLMMLDVRLNGRLDGWEVARRARETQPNLAVVYTTTADGLAFARECVDRSVLLQKPYTLDRVVSSAREACRMIEEGT